VKTLGGAVKNYCTVCGTQSILEGRIDEANLYRCPSCSHCFTGTDSIWVPEKYGESYFDEDHRNWFNNPNLPLFEKLAGIINKDKPDGSVIDLGCGNGDFLKYLHRSNSRLSLTGIDLVANKEAEGIRFISGDILTTNLKQQYDVVVCLAVIEHFIDLRPFMKKVYDTCRPGGLVIIMTLNDGSVLYNLARLMKNLGYAMPYRRLYSKHHVNHFNIASLRCLAELNRLSVIDTLRHNTVISAVDVPASSGLVRAALKAAVAGIFFISKMNGKTYLQTIVCRKGFDAKEETSPAQRPHNHASA
jgi:SAM-dependent methyltransferase